MGLIPSINLALLIVLSVGCAAAPPPLAPHSSRELVVGSDDHRPQDVIAFPSTTYETVTRFDLPEGEHHPLRLRLQAAFDDLVIGVHAHLAGDDAAVFHAHRTRNSHLRHDQAQSADADVVRDVHQVVALGAGPDPGVAAAHDGSSSDLHVVLDDATADVRDALMLILAIDVAETVTADHRSGVQDRATYRLEMELWEASIIGAPGHPEWQWASLDLLRPGAGIGSLCCQLAIQSKGRVSF